ncbi:MAG: pyridoxal phosphate-dependent aminotransferase [Firmicutes bacterium]|nr:pyridoxal phosphate-dependent aminotransferase [Bacillota bacterium]
MPLSVTDRLQQLSPSPTMAIDAKVKSLIREGRDVINLTAGEPDFDTPSAIRQAAVAAMEKGETRYTPAGGTQELKRAVSDRLQKDTGLTYQPEEILVSVGAKHSLYNAVMALVSPGDGVLVPVPYWVTYPEQVRLAEGIFEPVNIAAERQGELSTKDLEVAITPKSRGLILNSPSNPSGAVIESGELQAIAEFVVDHDLWVLSDEIYGRLVYEGAEQRSIASFRGMRERTIVINGVSKAYAMTGWRIGYAAGPKEVIAAMANLQSQSTSNPSSISQAAAVAALTGDQAPVDTMRLNFDQRRRYTLERINRITGLTAATPKGAFYLWVDLSPWLGKEIAGRRIENGDDLAFVLLEEAGVGVLPGSGFGVDDHFRLSYATSMKLLADAMDRMQRLLSSVE